MRMNGSAPYTPDKTVNYENLVRWEFVRQCRGQKFPKDVALDARIMAFCPIPKSISNKKRKLMIEGKIRPTKKPDNDNVCKAILDALNDIAYYDDSQVVDSMVRKFYSENPRVIVTLAEAGGCE